MPPGARCNITAAVNNTVNTVATVQIIQFLQYKVQEVKAVSSVLCDQAKTTELPQV
jgi:hypothetical protein